MFTITTIPTRFHGAINIFPEDIITLDSHILGFPLHQEFILLPHRPNSPFQYLQSATDPDLAFIVTDPRLVFPNYQIIAEDLPAHLNRDASQILCICTTRSHPFGGLSVTANFKSPVIFDTQSRHGGQFVLSLPYSYHYPLIGEALENVGAQPKN